MSDVTRSFKLSQSFLSQYEGKQPNWGPVGYVTYKRTYARPKPDGSTEEYFDTCRRVVEGCYNIQKDHCKHLRLPWNNVKAQKSAQEMFTRMWEFKWLPPGRGLWMMGVPHVDKVGSAALNNCGFTSTIDIKEDFAYPFTWLMDMLMLGVGVGFDTRGAGTVKVSNPTITEEAFIVEDSREGWVLLLETILRSFVGKNALPSVIDYTNVRPMGEPIKGFGGTSSGPGPLKELIQDVTALLTARIGETISVTDIVDICNLVGRCVVAGNTRRSAQLALGVASDNEFLNLKNPDVAKDALLHHRWASNNSVLAEVGMDYSHVAHLTSVNGEPGYVWMDNVRKYGRMADEANYKDMEAMGTNPCSEQTLFDKECCTLVETFPSLHDSYEDYKKTLKYAYLYAKSVTLVPTHSERTNLVMQRNRRIGTSMSGISQAIKKHGTREFFNWCDRGYKYLKDLDSLYSNWLCIRESIKITSIKPAGTTSLLPGVTPGIHYPHAPYYIRRIRFQEGSKLANILASHGYHVEKDQYSPNTVCVSFPIEEQHFDRSKDEVTMWEQLELAAQMQYYWADNQVSVTVTFSPKEANQIKHALELYETKLKSVSFLPIKEHGYVQAPMEKITKEEYNDMMSKITPTDLSVFNENEVVDKFCDGDKCVV